MDASAEERFDVFDDRGNPMGTATREETHARGLWHHTFHCWLVRRGEDGRARVLFQKRSDAKDTNPGSYDISAAGHLCAGETPADAVRELEEELGLAVTFERLVSYGIVREEASGESGGKPFIDREISHVFGLVTARKPEDFRLQEAEVAGLYEADARQMMAMMNGMQPAVPAQGVRLSGGGLQRDSRIVTVSEFVPRDLAYYADVFGFLLRLAEETLN